MAAKIKLQRKGTKNKPYYRVVVQDESSSGKAAIIERLGQYNPLLEPTLFEVDKEKTLAWIKKGAKPTDRVRILLGKAGIMEPVDLAALPKRKSKAEEKKAASEAPKKEEVAKEAPAATEEKPAAEAAPPVAVPPPAAETNKEEQK